MNITRLLPKALPTTFGTPQLVDLAKAAGRRKVELLLPPVDVHLNAPGAVDPQPFRKRYGIEYGAMTLVTVSRLSDWVKSESLIRTLGVVRTLGRDLPLRFVIVGMERYGPNSNGWRMRSTSSWDGLPWCGLGRSSTHGWLMPRPTLSSAWVVRPCVAWHLASQLSSWERRVSPHRSLRRQQNLSTSRESAA